MRFVKYFLMVSFICVIVMGVIYIPFRRGYNTYYSFEQSRLKEIIKGTTNYDALFIGSSRTFYHVNPKVVDSVLNVRSFNAGIDGANIIEMNMILKCYLASHPAPKYIITDLAIASLAVQETPVFNPNIYFPFLNNNIIYTTLQPYKRVALLKYLPFLQLTEADDNIRQGVLAGLSGKQKPHAPTYRGYMESGNDTIGLPFKVKFLTTYFPIDKEALSLLEETIQICKKNDIRLIISYSPVYQFKDEKMNPEFLPTLRSICNTHHIPFFNYRSLSINNNHLLFRDEHHLNRNGANIFSYILADDIKKLRSAHPNSANSNNLHQVKMKDQN